MRRVTRLLEHLSQSSTPVLVVGEAGTGKGVVAEMLHQLSPRAGRAFVRVSCDTRDGDDAYSALMGKGNREEGISGRGLLAAAAGGSLFLDNVGGLTPRMQDLLLDVLRDATLNVRVIAATARDLAQEMRAGTLRAELYQRLALLPLAVPSLRNRGEEAIRVLAFRMLQGQRLSLGRGPLRMSEEAGALLSSLAWPGNVPQLRSVIEESFIVALDDEVLEPSHLRDALERTGLEPAAGTAGLDEDSLEYVERRHIARILARTGGHRTEAAKLLGITRTTLYKKMREFGLEEVGGN
ncbi:MAG: sigma 54-interacting transcriptional regulator [Gemmatimonadales bacterium]